MEGNAARYRSYVILFAVLGLVVGGVIGYFTPRPRRASASITVSTPLPTATPRPTSTPRPIRVYVSGAVKTPAVYELRPGSIVQDAIDAAGGPVADADLESINLALELQDQQHIHVPCEGEMVSGPSISGGPSSKGGGAGETLVNINTATQEELETLPNVGPKTAQDIIEYRQSNGSFQSIGDIQNVSGIGEVTFEKLKDKITVSQSATTR